MNKPAYDQVWTVVKPRNGSEQGVQEMNARCVAFHPQLHEARREDHELLQEVKRTIEGDTSIAELFRRTFQMR